MKTALLLDTVTGNDGPLVTRTVWVAGAPPTRTCPNSTAAGVTANVEPVPVRLTAARPASRPCCVARMLTEPTTGPATVGVKTTVTFLGL